MLANTSLPGGFPMPDEFASTVLLPRNLFSLPAPLSKQPRPVGYEPFGAFRPASRSGMVSPANKRLGVAEIDG